MIDASRVPLLIALALPVTALAAAAFARGETNGGVCSR